ncbi:MAG: cyclic 2,3-diphosphoglycerate synthase [Desulfobacterales bacterium]|jgi:predicted GTPase|nr:cyclic 2,3-diphosphoglycerate synthase [Desulfobacterales bacterium]
MKPANIIIIGAAGRDFHNFNMVHRDNDAYRVVAFTAAQIPDIDGRKYPAALAGRLYPKGIPIHPEAELPKLIRALDVSDCIFSYSDVSYQHVMNLAAVVQAAGANFTLLGPRQTMLKSTKPVVSVGAVRTGCGKSQTARRIIEILMGNGLKVVAVRHPMPYGDLAAQKVQRFAKIGDLAKHTCTVEEMEEYEPHIVRGNVIYAGVDYEAVLRAAETDSGGCDVILWDGGNNDFPFFKPDLHVTVLDPHRPGHELSYYPGNVTLRLADVVVINKIDSAGPEGIDAVRRNAAAVNPRAVVIEAASVVDVETPSLIRGQRVLAVEDGPTLTHGGMKIGAAAVAARKFGAAEIVDPRPYLKGRLKETFRTYPGIGAVLPAMGYGARQLKDLAATINATECDAVVIGTPIDLGRVITITKPSTRVFYGLQEIGTPNLSTVLAEFILQKPPGRIR